MEFIIVLGLVIFFVKKFSSEENKRTQKEFLELLRDKMKNAIEREDYEEAAELRDQINLLIKQHEKNID